ncbi:MAG: hypothetical protein LM569_03700 [Desulfurococcaceae archaeon]|jgi:hypothetical protein|nr:hypothetical protein [Desulfurococcaceae archaeon]
MESTGGLTRDEFLEVNPATRPDEEQWISCLVVMSRLRTRVFSIQRYLTSTLNTLVK